MRVKGFAKHFLSEIVYVLFQCKILSNSLKVATIDITIEELINSEKSFVRFGDGEIRLIEGDRLPLQDADEQLAKRLREILNMREDSLMVGIPYIFDSLREYRKESRTFWKEHLLFFRKKYEKYCQAGYQYYDAFFSRLYYMYDNRELSRERFERIKEIWKDRDLVIIESKSAHTGVDNDLLIRAKSVKRIICPESNAWFMYRDILSKAFRYDKNTMFLISAGATAKPMVVDLMEAGYRALDIGSLDMEYQWYYMNATQKCHPPKKNCLTLEQDKLAGYEDYLSQIDVMLGYGDEL